jgi:hypothetical protein
VILLELASVLHYADTTASTTYTSQRLLSGEVGSLTSPRIAQNRSTTNRRTLGSLPPDHLFASSSEGEVDACGITEVALGRIVKLIGEARPHVIDLDRPELE